MCWKQQRQKTETIYKGFPRIPGQSEYIEIKKSLFKRRLDH